MLEKIKNDELMKGSFVLLFMIGIFNILNYLFQISMAKMLGPADYGVLAVLISLIYIFGIPNEGIQTIISRYVSKFNINKKFGKIKYLMQKSLTKGLIISGILFVCYIPAAYLLASSLKISFGLFIATGLFIFYVFSMPIIRGLLQGRKKFLALGFNLVIEGIIKVAVSTVLVLFSFRVYGAIIGCFIAGLLAFASAFYNLKEIIRVKKEQEKFSNAYFNNLPVLIAVTSLVLMYSLDVILAKRFFPAEQAGIYAFVSMIAKSIIFFSQAVGKAMFPIASEGFEKGEKTNDLFKKSMMIIGFVSAFVLILFLAMPTLIIRILSLNSSQYLPASNILFLLGLAFSLIAITNIIVTYKISVNKSRATYFLFSFVFLEFAMLCILHSSLLEFSIGLLISSTIMFLYSLFLIKK